MMKFVISFTFASAIFMSAWQSPKPQQVVQPSAKQLSVNGTTIRYWEQGSGAPVVFVHGAISDHRYWEPQREAVAKKYRFIALDRRYFGTAPWPDDGVHFSQATQVADLAAFIRELKIGQVFLVGSSGGAGLSLVTAVQYPELVRGLFVNEPGLRSILTDPSDQKAISENSADTRLAARASAKAGNLEEAARLRIDYANGQTGSFDAAPPTLKAMFVDNARTILLEREASQPVRITCAQLGQIKVPVTITKGELTKPDSRILAEAAHRCIPGSNSSRSRMRATGYRGRIHPHSMKRYFDFSRGPDEAAQPAVAGDCRPHGQVMRSNRPLRQAESERGSLSGCRDKSNYRALDRCFKILYIRPTTKFTRQPCDHRC